MKALLSSLFMVTMLLITGCTAESTVVSATIAPTDAIETSTEEAAPSDSPSLLATATELEESPTFEPSNTARAATTSPSNTPHSTSIATTSSPPITPTETCVPRSDWFAYTIRAGDTLGRIALAANTTVALLQTANCLPNVNSIIAGQRLLVPVQNLVLPTATATVTLTYTPTVTLTPSHTPTACTINPNLPKHEINSRNIQDFGQGDTLINGIAMTLGVTRQHLLQANCLSEAEAASIGSGTVLAMPGRFEASEFDFVPPIIGEQPTDCLDNC